MSNPIVTVMPRARLLLSLLVCLSATAGTRSSETLLLPHPSGLHSIGTHVYEWLDRSRNEKASQDPREFRQLIVQTWYPAQPSKSPPAPYVPRLNAYREVWEKAAFDAAAHTQSHSRLDATAAPGVRAPIVLLSHGWEETRTSYTSLAEGPRQSRIRCFRHRSSLHGPDCAAERPSHRCLRRPISHARRDHGLLRPRSAIRP